jgi:MFS family permease
MGGIGVALAPVLRIFVRDLPSAAARTTAPIASVFPLIARKPAFWLLAFGASASSLCGYGLALWTPSILMRSFGLTLLDAGKFLASLVIIGGCAGVYLGGLLADRLAVADRRWYVWLPAIAWLITAPTFVAGFFAPSLTLAWLLLLIPNALNILWLGPIVTAVQHLVPAPLRATASGSFLFVNNLIGLGVGPWLIGYMSDRLTASHGADALRQAAVACCAFYLLAALLAFVAARSLGSGWVSDQQAQESE